jgi:hypothetical protein
MNFRPSLFVILFATQLGASAAYSEVRSGRPVELDHGLVIKTAGPFLSPPSHPIGAPKLFETPKPEAPYNDLLRHWQSQEGLSTNPTGILHPLPKTQTDLDIIKDEKITKDIPPIDTRGKNCPHKDDALSPHKDDALNRHPPPNLSLNKCDDNDK